EAVMDDDILKKLQGVKAWRDYEARVEQRGEAKAEARIAEAEDKAKQAEAIAKADDLTEFFYARGDELSAYAREQIDSCTSVSQLSSWLRRAYRGETSSEIFPEP
ncbi:MAG: hypothetical protein FWE35_26210, partial [Streptosporangiales bacterium]|nr:hypothetical protein [Streptosporangiales bacterium]